LKNQEMASPLYTVRKSRSSEPKMEIEKKASCTPSRTASRKHCLRE